MIPAAESLASQLAQLIAEGLIVSFGVTLCFSLALVGAIRASEARNDRRAASLVSWSLLAVVAFAAFSAFVVLGVLVVANKQ